MSSSGLVPGVNPQPSNTRGPAARLAAPVLPEWIRIPPPGKAEPLTGLRRNVLYDLVNARAVRSVAIRKPGAIRGVRLIETRSLLAYLDRLAEEQAAEPAELEAVA